MRGFVNLILIHPAVLNTNTVCSHTQHRSVTCFSASDPPSGIVITEG